MREWLHQSMSGLSRAVFLLSIAVLGFAIGFLVRDGKMFPYTHIDQAVKTLLTLRDQLRQPFAGNQFLDFSGGAFKDISDNRVIVRAPVPEASGDEHFLLSGGHYQYLDYCPKQGCIAVELTRRGTLVHAYPYRPAEFEAHQTVSLPYEQPLFDFAKDMYPIGMTKLPGGDLIVIFNQWNSFPYAGGVARVREDGSVAWFRHDYSHHWPRLLPNGDLLVPGMQIAGSQIAVPLAQGMKVAINCNGKIMADTVRILDPDGQVKQEIPVLDALLRSPFRGGLIDPPAPCYPLHLNYIVPVNKGIVSLLPDVSPDDFVISLRDLDSFAILGRADGRIKHLYGGTFLRQHSVQPLGESTTVLIFDNHGADQQSGPSRLLAFDLATHRERTVLPDPEMSRFSMFSNAEGNISISPDYTRALVASSEQGTGVEVRIADGQVLTLFNSIHDLRKVPAAGDGRDDAAARFNLYNALYVH